MNNTIIELPETFTLKGWQFTQYLKGKKALIYTKKYKGDNNAYFEVFERKTTQIFTDFNTKTLSDQLKVRYPHDNDFGAWAFCCKSAAKALSRFEEMENKQIVVKV